MTSDRVSVKTAQRRLKAAGFTFGRGVNKYNERAITFSNGYNNGRLTVYGNRNIGEKVDTRALSRAINQLS